MSVDNRTGDGAGGPGGNRETLKRRVLQLPTNRLETLSDGVFAIAMTLLVLDLRIPQGMNLTAANVHQYLVDTRDDVFMFGVTFLVLAIIWIFHHRQFHLIQRVDSTFFWISMAQLMLVVLVPFSASIMSDYYNYLDAELLFGANIFCIGILFVAGWAYSARGRRLIDPSLEPEVTRWMYQRSWVLPAVSLLVMLTAVFSPEWAPLGYCLTALLLIPGRRLRRLFPASRHTH
jgi:uncharacterized membrane protein